MSDILQFGNYFTFDDIQSNTFGVWISGTGTFDAPERDVTTVTIPGRSGDLLRDNNRFKNIKITYPAFISKQFDTRFDTFKAAMLAKAGKYYTLTDTYHPNEFRIATYKGKVSPKTGPYNKSGEFNIEFECKPQRWLNSGLTITTLTDNGSITNPTQYTARPNIRVYGYGTLGVGSITVTIAQNSYSYIDIDCEAMAAFYGSNNANGYVTITGDTFPVLAPGTTNITKSSTITRIEIQPRWWTV